MAKESLIRITGGSGFVGTNLQNYLKEAFKVQLLHLRYIPNLQIKSYGGAIIHLVGKAHDLKKTSNSNEYYKVNTELIKKVFDAFIASDAKVFITLSSVKAVADEVQGELTEEHIAKPITHYGKSKLLAEQYILSQEIPEGKRIYILRPCMIHGPGNKGNLNLLFQLVSKGIPWPLGAFDNKRSFCSIDNLMFIIKELMEQENIPSGVYNVADDTPLSTNEVISILAESQNKKPMIWNVSKSLIQAVAKISNLLKLPLNEERLQKLTDSYIVSNQKIKLAIGKSLPVSSKEGLLKTFKSFKN
jgi:nucleoside-diphosphate-sugar epimerase